MGIMPTLFCLNVITSALLLPAEFSTRLSLEQGTILELHPDGNSLDMMEGLISRKIPRPLK